MGRKSFKKFHKSLLSNSARRPDNLYLINISFKDIFGVIDSESPDSGQILKNMVISGISMMIMAQITLSAKPENAEYVDKLPSYRDIKKKFITGPTGRTLASAAGLASSFPWLLQDPSMQGGDDIDKIILIITNMVDMPSPNTKRIKPSVTDWPSYAKGEASGAMGQMISCPATNFKAINIDSNIASFDLTRALKAIGINSDILNKFNITPGSIASEMKSLFLIESTGLPISNLIYNEPNTIQSIIQSEILGDSMVRSGKVNTNLVKGLEPDSAITKTIIEKYLSSREQIAYKFAINTGDKNILRKYTDMVKNRIKAESSKVVNTPPGNGTGAFESLDKPTTDSLASNSKVSEGKDFIYDK